MPPEKEIELCALKREIEKATQEEICKIRKTYKYRENQNIIRKTKNFLSENNLAAVRSDKCNRIVITDKTKFEKRVQNILNDENTYRLLLNSKQAQIERQANSLIKSISKNNFNKIETEKLLSTGSKPANFDAFIKDHKAKDEDGYPLRPIASVRNTATEKVDWLVSCILTNLVQYVPANLKNSKELKEILKSVDLNLKSTNPTFISLDVVSLYPSIPLDFGLDCALELAENNWNNIDNMGLTVDQMMNCLKFVCYNYEIQYGDKVYKQIKGCPMGAHFAPPFAIITMHKIETMALSLLKEKTNFSPQVYRRYL